jgi:tRNA (adenine57-N1/adenine58-N1)-methyltransferase catalytic subunit
MSVPFETGEKVLLVDQRDRTYLFRLQSGATYHTHSGTLAHDEILGRSEGATVLTAKGMVLIAFRPRFADYVLKMPRGAQVVYPKDLGPIVTYADIFPGARVLEAGTGSGALTIALARAVGADGAVVSYERRPEHRAQGLANIDEFFGGVPGFVDLREGDLDEVAGTDERYDRAVLDIPDPWAPLVSLAKVLHPGAVLVAYVPTTVQLQQFVLALNERGFHHVESFETLRRGWHVTSRSVRPDHRMVGHTGFLTIARRLD